MTGPAQLKPPLEAEAASGAVRIKSEEEAKAVNDSADFSGDGTKTAVPPSPAPAASSASAPSSPSSTAAPAAPSTFAAPIGVILPPPDVRVVIDRTADFVRKTGAEGEEQLISKNRGQRKFAFLLSSSPYHAYYRQRVQHGAAAAAINDSAPSLIPTPPSAADAAEAEQRRLSDEQRQRDEAERKRKADEDSRPLTLLQRLQAEVASTQLTPALPDPSDPPPFSFSYPPFYLAPPAHYSSSDIDVVNLTALYSAALGASFVAALSARERSNPQFDFLKTVHPLHAYYTHVTTVYQRVMERDEVLLRWYAQCAEEDDVGLRRLLDEARWKRRKDEDEERERRTREEETETMAAIDWHSFVVVETIEFHPDEEAYLPPPKRTVEEMEALIAELAIEEDREREERERRTKEEQERSKQLQQGLFLDASLPSSVPTIPAGEGIIDHVDELLEIRQTAAAPAPAAPAQQSKLVTCVVCGDTIAAEDLEEHLRIELLDPRWKEQKQALIDRQRESSLVAGKSLMDNLRRLERKKREVGRERSKEDEERQAKEDALLLRGAAREQPAAAVDDGTAAAPPPSSVPFPPPSAAALSSAPAPSMPPASASMDAEPLAKRLRPSSPRPLPPPTFPTGGPAASIPSESPALSFAPPAAVQPVPPAAAAPAPAPPKPQQAFVPESLWLSANPLPLTLHLHVPSDESSSFLLRGQTVTLPMQLTDSVDALKVRLTAELGGLPGNRQQFQLIGGAFLKEGNSFAYYNLFDGAHINLKLKERGGKKK